MTDVGRAVTSRTDPSVVLVKLDTLEEALDDTTLEHFSYRDWMARNLQ